MVFIFIAGDMKAELIFYTPMATYTKQPTSIAVQMSMLKNRRLLFDDEQATIEYLKIISYVRLANYWKTMDVVTLCYFVEELRSHFFSAIQSIEIPAA